MQGRTWIRQTHRWVSMAFTATVLLNIALLGQSDELRMTVAYLPLLPLGLLFLSGLYLFALPYLKKGQAAKRPE